ncbi:MULTISPECIES: PrpR N-terminal domain-containing protein [Aneurinibacillus]|jgi:PAS domain S-box-containing protein|uniref:Sigma-54-dependent Fis family transcriptional regulator n=1 Tax=Aneurinibacillus danicus TaxID=267746 RepID=A0A511VCP7_9BACL|nr:MULTISPECIES: PrpR N-terminal domain-containing protein [Aneurinibacillus]GEN36667.1 sigma-54-dependent Fis family transcriptional regulator [Aneurinibacillus danicus]
MARILVIAPYPGLKDLFLQVNKELKKEMHVEVGDLHKGLAIAKEMEGHGFDVIVSRGATARLLRQHCNLPVVEVKISGYDILRTLTLIKGYEGKIGLMSYFNTIQGADAIGTLLDMNLSFFPINHEEEIEKGIRQAHAEGIQVIIGDVISTSVATRFGLNAILITSGKEAVIESLEEAEHMSFYTRKEKQEKALLTSIINGCEQGIIAVDGDGKMIFMNEQAERLFATRADQEIGRPVEELHPQLQIAEAPIAQADPGEEVVMLNGENIVIRKTPLVTNKEAGEWMITLQEISRIQKAESRIRYKLLPAPLQAHIHFNHLVAVSETMHNPIETARFFSKNAFPVLIYGEPGTGKESIAQAIHNESERKEAPFVFFNCEAYSEDQLEIEIFGLSGTGEKQGIFETAHKGTLFIDAIGRLPLSIQAMLINVLQEKKVTRLNGEHPIPIDVRIIAANARNLQLEIEEGNFREDLFYLLNGGEISVPPLRERKEDIPELVRWFIASFNVKFGKQIAGIRPEVMERLLQASWPGNVQQLRNTVEKLCMASAGPFIEEEEANSILDRLFAEANTRNHSKDRYLDIAGKTLEQMEKEIILRVLEEENHNQSHAAKRLGINRSTLWRKIKNEEIK